MLRTETASEATYRCRSTGKDRDLLSLGSRFESGHRYQNRVANLTIVDDAPVKVPTLRMRCTNCKKFQIIAYLWIAHCPGCGIAFECDEQGYPIVIAKDGERLDIRKCKTLCSG